MKTALPASLALLALTACRDNPAPPAPSAPATASASAASASGAPSTQASAAKPSSAMAFTMTPVALPGATGAVGLDYLAVDRAAARVWVPAGGTGNVDVIDGSSRKITPIAGFPTVERDMGGGQKRSMGVSSAAVGNGVVYVGSRAGSQVCVVDAQKMAMGACVTLPSAPDGLVYVASAKELWATTPADGSIVVLDASTPAKLVQKTKIAVPGKPEGYAVDDAHGVFFTNLEDKDKTLVIDVKSHAVTATWEPSCGGDGPRGLAFDTAKQVLFVACTDHVESLDAAHGGALLSKVDTGAGVDNIDYVASKGELFVVAGKDAKLTVAKSDAKGMLTVVGTAPTSPGTRVVVADEQGNAYVADGAQGRILVMTPTP